MKSSCSLNRRSTKKLRNVRTYAQTLRSLFITFVVVVSHIQRHFMLYVVQPCRLLVAKSSTSHAQLDSAPCQYSKCVPDERIFPRFSPPCGHGFTTGRGDATGVPHNPSTPPKHSILENLRYSRQIAVSPDMAETYRFESRNASQLQNPGKGAFWQTQRPQQGRLGCDDYAG